MPKLDLDAAKERVEWSRQHMATGSASTLISHVLPAALAECEWSREMLERAKEHLEAYADMCRDVCEYEDEQEVNALLRDLEGKEETDAQDEKG